jgi:hypothetical protein
MRYAHMAPESKEENRVSENPMFLYAGEYESVEDAKAFPW